MGNYFECKLRYEKRAEDGDLKRVRGTYLVEAMSFTEAEGRVVEGMRPYVGGDLRILSIKRAGCVEVYGEPDGAEDAGWFRCKVALMSVNEKTGKVKKTATVVMVEADGMRGAMDRLEELMKGTVDDWQPASLTRVEMDGVFYRQAPEEEPAGAAAGSSPSVEEPAAGTSKSVVACAAPSKPAGIGYAATLARDEAAKERAALKEALHVAGEGRAAAGASSGMEQPSAGRYTKEQEKRLRAEAMATLPFTEGAHAGVAAIGDVAAACRVTDVRPVARGVAPAGGGVREMKAFITDSLKRKSAGGSLPGMEPVAGEEPDAAYKAVVKAVFNSGSYGVPMWRLRSVAGVKDDAAVRSLVKRMAAEGLAERYGQTVRKKLAELPKRFV